MPGKHTPREKRMAAHVAASEKAAGKSDEEAERIGWMTVNSKKTKKKGLHSLGKK